MKFGLRTFSAKKRISSRLTGTAKRTLKRAIIPGYGKKGIGWINNPKKATYNHIYSKTTMGIDEIGKEDNQAEKQKQSAKNDDYIGIIIVLIILLLIFIMAINSEQNANISGSTTDNQVYSNENEVEDRSTKCIKDFLSTIEAKSFTEYEAAKRFKEMMLYCSKETIYNKLFSDDLKANLSFEEFKEYSTNVGYIEHITARVMVDDSVYIFYMPEIDGGKYSLKIKDKKIIEYEKE